MEETKGRGSAATKKKKPNLFLRLLAFLLTAALVLGAVILVVNWDKLNLDAVKRYFAYRDLERSDNGQARSFFLESGGSPMFVDVNGDLLMCSTSGVRIYSGSGVTYVTDTFPLENPAADAAGATALVYDAGGQELRVYANRMQKFSLTLDGPNALLSARVNRAGWIAVTAQESGYKGAVTVYDSGFAPVMQVSLSSRFVMDAVLSPDNTVLAVLTIGTEAGEFDSRVDLYRLDGDGGNTQPDASCALGNNTILTMHWGTGGLWVLGESAASVVNADGTLAGTYDYNGRYLKDFTLKGDGTAVFLLGKYRAGTSAELAVVNASGQVRAALQMEEQVLSLSAAGRYIGLLTADRLDIYDQDLKLYAALEGTQGAQQVVQRTDGSAMLIDKENARLYVPE